MQDKQADIPQKGMLCGKEVREVRTETKKLIKGVDDDGRKVPYVKDPRNQS